jgi:hypothetical protein
MSSQAQWWVQKHSTESWCMPHVVIIAFEMPLFLLELHLRVVTVVQQLSLRVAVYLYTAVSGCFAKTFNCCWSKYSTAHMPLLVLYSIWLCYVYDHHFAFSNTTICTFGSCLVATYVCDNTCKQCMSCRSRRRTCWCKHRSRMYTYALLKAMHTCYWSQTQTVIYRAYAVTRACNSMCFMHCSDCS